jgi:hypothetical protein
MNLIKKLAAAAALAAVSVSSFAAVDTASVTASITEAGSAVGVVGAAVLVVMVGVKVFKWVARAL